MSFTVTGTSSSRINELSKYVVTNLPWDRYYLSTTPTVNGVDLTKSNTGGTGGFYVYTYYLDSITYTDTSPTGTTGTSTTFSFQSLGTGDTNNFDNFHIIKLESKENMVENPIIGSDVNIIRQDIPVFEMTVRLRSMAKLNDVLTYAGGGVFTIYNNS